LVFYIADPHHVLVPNEFAERFCYYGLNPLLNKFFRDYLGLGAVHAMELRHAFTAMVYFTPLLGAAISDSLWGKYATIVYLSIVYVGGVGLTSLFSAPNIIGNPPALWGPLTGLLLVALGSGGIKPCVSAHGGDQFLAHQENLLNKFYDYFYMAINAGSMISGFVTPMIADQQCFGVPCYAGAFGLCALVMFLALILFIVGKPTYRHIPPAGTFVPWTVCKVLCTSFMEYINAPSSVRAGRSVLSFAQGLYPSDIIDEVRDVSTMFLVLLPTPFFWMAFDQNGSTWQNQYTQMRPIQFGSFKISEEQVQTLNPILILLLVPVFQTVIYPFIENRFGKFKMLDRLMAGMFLAAISFGFVGLVQSWIDARPELLIMNSEGTFLVCNPDLMDQCVNGWWQLLPYFVITCGEVMLSITGLSFTYQEVGSKMKSSSASLWLLMVALGNIFSASFANVYAIVGPQTFMYVNSGIIIAAMLVYVFIRKSYVYRADRQKSS
jgi:dipeptide/tripeptide permease